MRAGSLSGAPRRTLALASYVTSVVCIAMGSIIWWVLILVRPYLFFAAEKTVYTPGVDTWLLVVVFVAITCDAAGRLGGVFRRARWGDGESPSRVVRGRRYRRRRLPGCR